MQSEIISKIQQKLFDVATGSIRSTPPIDKKPGDIRFVSLVCHRDLNRYLIAIKSVYQKIGRGDVVILNDGSLTDDDLAILDKHLAKPTLYNLSDIPTGPCPSYICWSRLLLIAELCKDNYIVQVDSDIVAQGALTEAIGAIERDEAFILVNKGHPGRIKMGDIAAWLDQKGWNNPNSLQLRAERAFSVLPMADQDYYVRGSAAFVGFPRDSINRAKIERFSVLVEEQLGELWQQWGSEQTTTNYAIANAPVLHFLEFPDYVNHLPKLPVEKSELVHFFGTHRYHGNRYLRSARQAIKSLAEK